MCLAYKKLNFDRFIFRKFHLHKNNKSNYSIKDKFLLNMKEPKVVTSK